MHISSRFQYKGTKITSPFYFNNSYIINPGFCEGTLRNLVPIKSDLLFIPFYARLHLPTPVPIDYLQFVEGGATNFMNEQTFNVLYSDWIADKLANREPSAKEQQILSQVLAKHPTCNADLYPRALAACLTWDKEYLEFFRHPDNRIPDYNFRLRLRAQSQPKVTVPTKQDPALSNSQNFF